MQFKKIVQFVFIWSTLLSISGDLNVFKVFSSTKNEIVGLFDFTNIFELLSIISLFLLLALDKSFRHIPKIYVGAVFMMTLFLISSLFSFGIITSVMEVSKFIILLTLSFSIFQLIRSGFLSLIISILLISFILISIASIYDYFASNYNMPTLGSMANSVNFTSFFGSFDSTSNYAYIYLLIFIPLRLSKACLSLKKYKLILLDTAIILGSIVLLGTGRVSIIIGYTISIIMLNIINRNIETLVLSLKIFFGILFFSVFIHNYAPNAMNNIVYRFNYRIFERKSGTPEADFIVDNFTNTWRAFSDNPISGTGLRVFKGYYSETDIHGTYLWLIGEMGLIGVSGYMIFIIMFIITTFKYLKNKDYLIGNIVFQTVVFLTGFLIAHAYNNHIREKMFWVFIAIYVFYVADNDKKHNTAKSFSKLPLQNYCNIQKVD